MAEKSIKKHKNEIEFVFHLGDHDEDAKDLKEALKLDENSNVLLISTEGDTDPVRYREIVWDGLYGTDKSLSK